jgi:hypothetical protein
MHRNPKNKNHKKEKREKREKRKRTKKRYVDERSGQRAKRTTSEADNERSIPKKLTPRPQEANRHIK